MESYKALRTITRIRLFSSTHGTSMETDYLYHPSDWQNLKPGQHTVQVRLGEAPCYTAGGAQRQDLLEGSPATPSKTAVRFTSPANGSPPGAEMLARGYWMRHARLAHEQEEASRAAARRFREAPHRYRTQ